MTGLGVIFAPGFFSDSAVHTALILGGVVAIVSAVVGTFTVIRGQSFAGHALSDTGSAGGSASFLVSVPSLYGFLAMNIAAAGVMELIGIRRPRGRDLAAGIVLGAALGLAALFLYEDTTTSSTTGATVNVLFGSIFTLSRSLLPVVVILAVVSLGLVGVLYRPLLLSSVSPDLAAVRGVPVRLVGIAYLLALALAVSMASLTIGAILSTALLIGPAATAQRLTDRTARAMLIAAVTGVIAVCIGIVLAYDSVSWTRSGEGWPASFFIVAVVFVIYLVAQIPIVHRRRPTSAGRR